MGGLPLLTDTISQKVKDLPWSSVLTRVQFVAHCEAATLRRLERASTLISERTPAEAVFAVSEGALVVEKQQPFGASQIVGFLFAGDTCGVVHGATYSYSVRALVDSEVLAIDRAAFERLCEEAPRMQRRVLEVATNELIAAQDHLVLLGRKTASERLASFLIDLERRRNGTAGSGAIWLPMRRSDIANHLGLTLETVSRLFSDFQKRGLLSMASLRDVRIGDQDALARLASGD